MSPQLRMLLWKERRERRTQFLICLLWMVGGTACSIAYRLTSGFRGAVIEPGLWYALFIVFIAMRTSLGETTEMTRPFTGALPISGHRWAWIRLAGGLAVLLVPILLADALTTFCTVKGWTWPRSARPDLHVVPVVAAELRFLAVHLSSATSLYVLLSLLGTALRKEAHAGFVGAAVAILWLLGPVLVGVLHHSAWPEVAQWVDVFVPREMLMTCSFANDRGLIEELWISSAMLCPLLFQGFLQFSMAAWFVHRYSRGLPGRVIETVRKTPSFLRRPLSLAFPNPPIALAWLTLRQSLPMCLPGLLIACAMASLLMIQRFPRGDLVEGFFAESLPTSMLAIGLLWSVVVGTGIFAAEIDWRVGEFWRTRPIPFWRFFATKFFVGLLAVLVVLDATTILASWSFRNLGWANYRSLNWAYLACIVPLHSVSFAIAVALTCLLRRSVLGGMVAIVAFAVVELIIHWSSTAARNFDPITVYVDLARGGTLFLAHEGYLAVTAQMVVLFLAATIVAGLALQRYDPRRQSD